MIKSFSSNLQGRNAYEAQWLSFRELRVLAAFSALVGFDTAALIDKIHRTIGEAARRVLTRPVSGANNDRPASGRDLARAPTFITNSMDLSSGC